MIMFSPSTAPRWKRQTRTGRSEAVEGGNGRYRANTDLARKSGSSPRLTNARPPFFTKIRLEIDMYRLLPSPTPLLFLEVRAADRQANGQRSCLEGVTDVGELREDDTLRMRGHRPSEQLLI